MSRESLGGTLGLFSRDLGFTFPSAIFSNFWPAWVLFVLGTAGLNLKIQCICSSTLLICTTNRIDNVVDHTYFFF